jgi:tRNA dimethylallyltransferase
MGLYPEIIGFLQGASKPLIVVLGQTASGKTSFSLDLAETLNHAATAEKGNRVSCEIVNADSRQLYRFLTIGTGKIRPEETRGIPHHLIDVLDPKEEATAAWYQKKATQKIDAILARHNVPVLVGGSMLYVSAVIDGLSFAPPSDPAIRKELEHEYDKDEGQTLYKRLEEADPETAASFDRRNKPYLIRAMELLGSVGKPSEIKKRTPPPYDILLIGIDVPREELNRRIDARVEQMFADKWVEEVQSLLKRGYSHNDPGMKSVGYREIAEAISSGNSEMGAALKAEIKAKTRQYAKRQRTWWKQDARIHWILPAIEN